MFVFFHPLSLNWCNGVVVLLALVAGHSSGQCSGRDTPEVAPDILIAFRALTNTTLLRDV